jgi:hypothetical protein
VSNSLVSYISLSGDVIWGSEYLFRDAELESWCGADEVGNWDGFCGVRLTGQEWGGGYDMGRDFQDLWGCGCMSMGFVAGLCCQIRVGTVPKVRVII